MASCGMDIDPPITTQGSSLKRSSSAPMIHVLTASCNVTSSSCSTSPTSFGFTNRVRRFSASNASLNSSASSHAVKNPSRISQIKLEEKMDIINREAAHEKEMQSVMQISHSCEDLSLTDIDKRTKSPYEPVSVFPSPLPLSSSPSPTRIGKQCFSPSMQIPVKNNSLNHSPIPSPTRKAFTSYRRSLSPIALKPSPLGLKRKYESDGEKSDCYLSPHKRSSSDGERLSLIPHPLTHSLSSSSFGSCGSLEDNGSPEQTVPLGSAQDLVSPGPSGMDCHIFKPVQQDSQMQQEDTEI